MTKLDVATVDTPDRPPAGRSLSRSAWWLCFIPLTAPLVPEQKIEVQPRAQLNFRQQRSSHTQAMAKWQQSSSARPVQ